MTISFDDARQIIANIAGERAKSFRREAERLSLELSVGRTVHGNLSSPISTPTFDTVAYNGYAVLSSQTVGATVGRPLQLRVMGSMFAGDAPLQVDDRIVDDLIPCVEVAMGAPFPVARSSRRAFDACIPQEHATVVSQGGGGKILTINRSPLTTYHKRIAGSDFAAGDVIIQKGTLIAPKHTMALASVGLLEIPVTRLARVGVLSVGAELASTMYNQQSAQYKVPDATGPYLTAALREMGDDAVYLGAIPDNVEVMTVYVREKLQADNFDLLVICGGVSGRSAAHTASCIAQLSGETYFEGVEMQPGESVLMSLVSPQRSPALPSKRQTVVFGLPSSPIASAACFRFLVTPYLRGLSGMAMEREIMAKLCITPETAMYRQTHLQPMGTSLVIEGSGHMDIFRHGILRSVYDGVSVELSRERSLQKTSPFASSNCWIHVPRGHVGLCEGDIAHIYPFCSPKS
ncbi:hypothetical protein BAUCODRAFT_61126 [Baudoinia panamericana UAMH 10762]|uniref:molybdopterin adenylyltransferase n=1 Tax=Baudoinia panamericana (strain UAMH 10762) TaxID=717646 RepID=M2MUM5_BAUPA|nr:uncharacterized protein BAUCODRAFT_61126 [Baudoinia panamericana UAMH 10762]EMD00632.1 hypothetical protein BAUCODRAFT_61126 [Baudoinia panamericana UAMH 10762]